VAAIGDQAAIVDIDWCVRASPTLSFPCVFVRWK